MKPYISRRLHSLMQYIEQSLDLADAYMRIQVNANPLTVSVIFWCVQYVDLNETSSELSVFWLSDTESRINQLMFSDSVSLSFKTKLTSVPVFAAMLCKVNFEYGTRDRHIKT